MKSNEETVREAAREAVAAEVRRHHAEAAVAAREVNRLRRQNDLIVRARRRPRLVPRAR
jgi:hypothetical protein